MKIELYNNDCLVAMKKMEDNSVDSIITDPPYGLSFMGKKWDYDVPSEEIWQECLRVLKPGGTALIFAGSRTQHRMAVRVEDSGFILKDTIMWVYGSGFPKATDISKQIDKGAGENIKWFGSWLKRWRTDNNIKQSDISALFPSKTGGITGCVSNWELGFSIPTIKQFNTMVEYFNLPFESLESLKQIEREIIGYKESGCFGDDISRHTIGSSKSKTVNITAPSTDEAKLWDGWKSHGLKPAYEPILVCMKPNDGTYANNALTHGVAGLNIAGSRVGTDDISTHNAPQGTFAGGEFDRGSDTNSYTNHTGRFPANLILDGSPEVIAEFPNTKGGSGKGFSKDKYEERETNTPFTRGDFKPYNDDGSAARYFKQCDWNEEDVKQCIYIPKTSKAEKNIGLDASNTHPTVKPISLMEYLCVLTKTPTGGVVLDPFMGSGSTGVASLRAGRDFIGIEMDEEYFKICEARIYHENEQHSLLPKEYTELTKLISKLQN